MLSHTHTHTDTHTHTHTFGFQDTGQHNECLVHLFNIQDAKGDRLYKGSYCIPASAMGSVAWHNYHGEWGQTLPEPRDHGLRVHTC